MGQITTAQLLVAFNELKERVKKLETKMDGYDSSLMQLDARIAQFERAVKFMMRVGGCAIGVLTILMPIISLIIQHYWK